MANVNQKFKTKIQADAGIQITTETASRVLQLDGTGNVASSTVTNTELSYVSGVTGPIQAQLDMAASESAQAMIAAQNAQADVDDLVSLSGVAVNSVDLGTFTGNIIPDASTVKGALQSLENAIESLPDPITYEGTWDASTNTPTLSNIDTGKNGDLYQVVVAGTVDFGAGPITFAENDKVVNNGTIWEKWDQTDAVTSVNGFVGAVSLTTTDIPEGTNLYFTDERTQDAVGSILVDSNTIDFTYNDATPSIVADVKTQLSLTSDASGIKLVNDVLAPGNTQYYGTNGSGTKGFFAIPAVGSAGDIQETPFSAANNQIAAANVTGLLFSPATVRSFKALVSVSVSATSSLYESFELHGVQVGATYNMSITSVGNDSGVAFSITSAGQVQYQSSNISGFTSDIIKFRAWTTTV